MRLQNVSPKNRSSPSRDAFRLARLLTARPADVDEAGAAVDATGKGKGGKSKADQEDIDALLAELEAPKQPAGEGAVLHTQTLLEHPHGCSCVRRGYGMRLFRPLDVEAS